MHGFAVFELPRVFELSESFIAHRRERVHGRGVRCRQIAIGEQLPGLGLFRGMAVVNVTLEQLDGGNDFLRVKFGFRRIEEIIGREFRAPHPHRLEHAVGVALFRNIICGNCFHQTLFDVLFLFRAAVSEPAVGCLDCFPHFGVGSVDSRLIAPFFVEVNKKRPPTTTTRTGSDQRTIISLRLPAFV